MYLRLIGGFAAEVEFGKDILGDFLQFTELWQGYLSCYYT